MKSTLEFLVMMVNYDNSAAYETPSYSNTGGTGDRTGSIAVSASWGTEADQQKLVDGVNAIIDSLVIPGGDVSGKYIGFEFPTPVIITEVRYIYHEVYILCWTGTTWQWKGSNTGIGVGGVNIGSSFVIDDSLPRVFTSMSAASVGYKYQWMEGVSGTVGSYEVPFEFEFKIGSPL